MLLILTWDCDVIVIWHPLSIKWSQGLTILSQLFYCISLSKSQSSSKRPNSSLSFLLFLDCHILDINISEWDLLVYFFSSLRIINGKKKKKVKAKHKKYQIKQEKHVSTKACTLFLVYMYLWHFFFQWMIPLYWKNVFGGRMIDCNVLKHTVKK